MKITINHYHAVASWKWNLKHPSLTQQDASLSQPHDPEASDDDDDDEDDVCGICRVAYDGCCPDCKIPGDTCPPSQSFLLSHDRR